MCSPLFSPNGVAQSCGCQLTDPNSVGAHLIPFPAPPGARPVDSTRKVGSTGNRRKRVRAIWIR
ncbi:hypothetical protein MPRS_25480 [Mycobacterium paraseoulense]|nr:hypothetical protein MPRS_25480 [Mycobacterium paraseoulense]